MTYICACVCQHSKTKTTGHTITKRGKCIVHNKSLSLIRPPGTLVPEGLMFYCRCFPFLFLSPGYLRAPAADRRETLPHDRNLGALYNASPKIRGALPPKKLGAKNMQNSAQFQTTSDSDREYLRYGTRHPKSERNMITSDSSRV